ncbi:hypothetical protein YPPY52_1833, partial [Yersinia pestis PY-52]
MGNAHG